MADTKIYEARDAIIQLLLALPWDERAECFSEVRWNGIFCCACGMGSPASPNANCQCQNDE